MKHSTLYLFDVFATLKALIFCRLMFFRSIAFRMSQGCLNPLTKEILEQGSNKAMIYIGNLKKFLHSGSISIAKLSNIVVFAFIDVSESLALLHEILA
jgi:hypothetical protein